MKKLVSLALILLVAGIIGIVLTFDAKDLKAFGTEPVHLEESVDSSSVVNIIAKTKGIKIDVRKGQTEQIRVSLEGKASKKYIDRFTLATGTNGDGDTVIIEAGYKDTVVVGLNIVDVVLIVELPDKQWEQVDIESEYDDIEIESLHASAAEITTKSGNIEAEQLQAAKLTVQSEYGDVDTERVAGDDITLTSDSGNIGIEDYEAVQLNIRSTYGDIKIKDGTGKVNGETDSGKIQFDAETVSSDLSLQSEYGDIGIEVSKQPASAELSLKHKFGDRDIEWSGVEASIDKEKEFAGQIGGGRVKIDVASGSGDIKLGIG